MENIVKVTVNVVKTSPSYRIKPFEARYLKAAGEHINVKVSLIFEGSNVVIHIRDREFYTLASALKYLRQITMAELVG